MPESKFIIGTKEDILEQQIVNINTFNDVIVKFEQKSLEKHKGLKLHTIDDHNTFKDRGWLCPYCEILDWGDPVPKAVIMEKMR